MAEITEGSWDDNIRHCITKIAHLHFTATDEYRNRVIQLVNNRIEFLILEAWVLKILRN